MRHKSKNISYKKFIKSQKGLTVLELICVLIIMGVLASIAVPKYRDLQAGTITTTVKEAVNELNGEVRQIFKKNKMNDDATGPYQGYIGNISPEVIITGQAPDTPGPGTIRLSSGSVPMSLFGNLGRKLVKRMVNLSLVIKFKSQ